MTYSLQRDDENYLDILENYNEEAAQVFAEAFGELQYGMRETNRELLGVVYEEMAMNSDAFGQHFTPHNLCDIMAELSISDADEDREEPYTVQDPASGSGRLLVSAAKKLPVDAQFYGVDKDDTCAKMTALNLCFFNMDGYAVQGDSLTMDYRRAWATKRTPMGGEIRELDPDEFENPYEQAKEEVEEETESPEPQHNPDREATNELEPSQEDSVIDLGETKLSDFTD